jgi:primosomal protein N' (replication factor Y)
MYIRKIVLKLENNSSPQKVREIVSTAEENFYAQNGFKTLVLYYDADPM